MNTSSVSVNMRTAAVDKGMWTGSLNDLIALPRPASPSTKPSSRRRYIAAIPLDPALQAGTKATPPLWISTPSVTVDEKILFGLLALAAAAAIGYGFISLVGYVQNWSIFNAWVARLLAA